MKTKTSMMQRCISYVQVLPLSVGQDSY